MLSSKMTMQDTYSLFLPVFSVFFTLFRVSVACVDSLPVGLAEGNIFYETDFSDTLTLK